MNITFIFNEENYNLDLFKVQEIQYERLGFRPIIEQNMSTALKEN